MSMVLDGISFTSQDESSWECHFILNMSLNY